MKRRVWTETGVEATAEGFAITLDGKPVRTPAGRHLAVPGIGLAQAIAAEWQAQGERVDPASMPLTRSANSALDKVAPAPDAVADMLAAYGDADLICYRADGPEGLIARQTEQWDPWIGWAESHLGARLELRQGVIHQPQPTESLAALAAAVRRYDAFALTGVHDLVTLSGSLVLGLAVAERALSWQEAWSAAHVDETWQEEQWGRDEEAHAAHLNQRHSFGAAACWLDLLRDI